MDVDELNRRAGYTASGIKSKTYDVSSSPEEEPTKGEPEVNTEEKEEITIDGLTTKETKSKADRIRKSLLKFKHIKPQNIPMEEKAPFGGGKNKLGRPITQNIAVMMLRKADGSQSVDGFKTYTFVRDEENKIAYAIFASGGKKRRSFGKNTKRRLFNTELAITYGKGWYSAHDAGTLEQIPFTQDKNFVSLFHRLDREMTQTSQAMILANTTAANMKNREKWWEKNLPNILLAVGLIILGIAIIQLGGVVSGVKTGVNNLGSIVQTLSGKLTTGLGLPNTSVSGLSPQVPPMIPTTISNISNVT